MRASERGCMSSNLGIMPDHSTTYVDLAVIVVQSLQLFARHVLLHQYVI